MARAKGRHWVALWLVAFLVTTWLVYARQTAAIHAARELGDLRGRRANLDGHRADLDRRIRAAESRAVDRKSTRLNSSHGYISYAVFCLKKKNQRTRIIIDVRTVKMERGHDFVLGQRGRL